MYVSVIYYSYTQTFLCYIIYVLSSVVILLSPSDALNNFDNGTRTVEGEFATAGIWATYPKPYLSATNGLIDQVIVITPRGQMCY